MRTKVINQWGGSMTIYENGDCNSGLTNVFVTTGNNPFIQPNNLTWYSAPTQIDASGSVITDLILAGKERVESGILYVYAIGHTGRLYKIQVNDPTSYNPDYDNPVLLTTLTVNSPTFTRGGFIDFFGTTQKIYIGSDIGVTSVNFDGTGEALVGVLGSWTQNVPRPLKQFLGNLYASNGANLTEIIQGGTVSTYAKLSPAFPTSSQVRDIDVSPDGNYLEAVVSQLALSDITSITPDVGTTSNSESYIFKWNGTDVGYTSFTTFPSFSLTANIMFQNKQYTFGYDQMGGAIFNPTEKWITEPEAQAAMPNAIASNGNLLSWFEPLYVGGNMFVLNNIYGRLDRLVGTGYWSQLFYGATGTETDVIKVPCQILVSNFGLGPSSNGYANGLYGTSKVYYSTLETSASPTKKYKFYKFTTRPSPEIPDTSTPLTGDSAVYQTQTELFSKKQSIKAVRIYGEPWIAGNSFQIDLIDSSHNPMTNGTQIFTAGGNINVGDDFAWWTPQCAPTYAIAVRITNLGTTNHVINKVEFDYDDAGQ
jgi:hypothetical protein